MIRKAAPQIAAAALLALVACNAYLAINHLERLENNVALTRENSLVRASIAAVSQHLTDMETGQRGYLVTGDPAYLQPYTEARASIGNDFVHLRSWLANRPESERSTEAQLESLTGSIQAEMERTISLRQQGYRHRAFLVVDTNEGKDHMDQARGLVTGLASMESDRSSRFEKERTADSRKALSETITANSFLLALTACLFWLIRYSGRGLEQEAAEGKRILAVRDLQLEKLNSSLGNQFRSKISVIEENALWLLEKYGGFLPRHGCEYAEQIKEAAAQMERLRKELVDLPVSKIAERAA